MFFHQVRGHVQAQWLAGQGYTRFADVLAHIMAWWEVAYARIERLAAGQYLNLSFPGFSDPEFAAMPYRVFSAIAEAITEAARVAPGVFIGRCADSVLREAKLPLLSVFVYSTDVQAKIARAVEVDGVPPKDAEKYIARMDKTRSRYQQFFTGTRFGDYREYDLCLNSGHLGIDTCADVILTALKGEAAP